MYKVLIVDDEALARVGLKSMIPWEEFGYSVIGDAENGRKAMEMALEHSPDIIITDLKMPLMSGIELIKELKNKDFAGAFIVLSAYDEFELVREVMKLGVENYILKLEMQPENLIEVLNRVTRKIEAEASKRKETQQFALQYHKNMPVLKEKFLKDIVFGRAYTNQEIEEEIKLLNITFPPNNIVCMVLNIEDTQKPDLFSKDDGYIMNFAIINILDEILSDYKWGYAFGSKDNEYVIVYSMQNVSNEKYIVENISKLTNSVKWLLKKYLNISVTIGVSNMYNGYKSVKYAYTEALKAVEARFGYPRGSTIMFQDVARTSGEGIDFDLSMELKSLEKAFNLSDGALIKSSLGAIKVRMQGTVSFKKEYVKGICSTIVFMSNAFLKDNGFAPVELWKRDPYEQLDKNVVQSDFIIWIEKLEELLPGLLKEINENRKVIIKTKQFIDKHYVEEVSLESVSEYLCISANYLSNLFKRETGENFIDYVTNVRINRAKELLKQSEYKVHEIGEMVGYHNEQYFSRVFKKVVGVSPIKYRTGT